MWDLPGPGIEPMSPALAGGFSATAPPGKSPEMSFDGGVEVIMEQFQANEDAKEVWSTGKGTEVEEITVC